MNRKKDLIDKVFNETAFKGLKHITSEEDTLIPKRNLALDKKRKIERIIDILYENERQLSDGYEYYGTSSTIEDIAKEILLSIEEN